MNIIQFFGVYLMFVLIGSLWISGWFIATRGKLVVMPDGKVIRSGMIFKAWYFFWNKELFAPERRYYIGDGLKDLLYHKIIPHCEVLKSYRVKAELYNSSIISIESSDNRQVVKILSSKFNLHFEYRSEEGMEGSIGMSFYEIYTLEKQYVFPEWARKMFANCVNCFAGVYGILSYSLLVSSAPSLFAWCNGSLPMILIYGVLYCLSVCTLNRFFNQNQLYSI